MENNPNQDTQNSRDRESFPRWQQRSIEELGKAISLLFTLSLATIGFTITQLLRDDIDFKNDYSRVSIVYGAIALLVCVVILLILTLNRLSSIRLTAQIARGRTRRVPLDNSELRRLRELAARLDRRTWLLFKTALAIFALGEILSILGYGMQIV